MPHPKPNLPTLVIQATVLRFGQPTLGLRLEGDIVVEMRGVVEIAKVREWVSVAVLPRFRSGSQPRVFYRVIGGW